MTYDRGTPRLFSVRELVVIYVLPLSQWFIWKLFCITQILFTISGIFKVESGLLNCVRKNITLKALQINIFTPQHQIRHPLSQCLKAIYISISKRNTTAVHMNIGLQMTKALIFVDFQYSNVYCLSYLSLYMIWNWGVVKTRVTCSILVNTLVASGVETRSGFRIPCGVSAPYNTVETCGASVGGLWFASGGSAHDADISCKLNRCKQS